MARFAKWFLPLAGGSVRANHALGSLAIVMLLAGCAHFEDKPLAPANTAQELEARSLGEARFQSFLATNLPGRSPLMGVTQFDFPALTLAAFYFHPGLDVARAQWAVARGGETTAGARPNPVLNVTPGVSANPAQGISPWFPSVTLDVPLETAGKRRYRMARAGHLSEAARLNIATAAWQVRSAVRVALVELTVANRRAHLLQGQAAAQESVVTLLEQRLAAGAIGSAEIAPARTQLIRIRADSAAAQRQATEARARIAESIGVPLQGIVGREFVFDLNQVPDAALLSADVRREALQGRADILATLAEYAASQSALQWEIARQYPDVHLNPGYQYDQGENKWALGLSVELPVLHRNQGPIAEARARRDEVAARFLALQSKVIAEMDRAFLNRAAALEQLRQLEAWLAAQRLQLENIETAFNAGAADQLERAAARVDFTAAELARLDALARKEQASGLLEDALQRPFAALSVVERDPKQPSHQHP